MVCRTPLFKSNEHLYYTPSCWVQDEDVVHYLQASGQEGSVGLWLNARAWAQDAVHTATKSLQENVIRPLTAKQRQEPLQNSSMVSLALRQCHP